MFIHVKSVPEVFQPNERREKIFFFRDLKFAAGVDFFFSSLYTGRIFKCDIIYLYSHGGMVRGLAILKKIWRTFLYIELIDTVLHQNLENNTRQKSQLERGDREFRFVERWMWR